MGVNSLPKTVTRQRRGCDLNPSPSAPESSTLTTRPPSHPVSNDTEQKFVESVLREKKFTVKSILEKASFKPGVESKSGALSGRIGKKTLRQAPQR